MSVAAGARLRRFTARPRPVGPAVPDSGPGSGTIPGDPAGTPFQKIAKLSKLYPRRIQARQLLRCRTPLA